MEKLAFLSFHSCPVARLGEKDTGGMNVYVLQLAKELARHGRWVDVYTRWHDPKDPEIVTLSENVRVIHIKACPTDQKKEDLGTCIPEFRDNVERFRQSEGLEYDLIHSHYWLSGWAGVTLSHWWKIPHVTTFHTLGRTKQRARPGELESESRITIEKWVMDKVDGITSSTQQERVDLGRMYGVSGDKVEVVPAGVDVDLFKPMDKGPARRRLIIGEEFVILYVGRIEPLKGIHLLIEALTHMEEDGATRLLIVGGKPGTEQNIEELKSLSERLGVADRVNFLGSVKQTELPIYYNAADVFALPSYYESFGLVALEAMACATPVLVSRVGGLPSYIRNGECGYLVPWQCPEPFAQRLEVLKANRSLGSAMGRAGRLIAERMSWASMCDRYLDFYSEFTKSTLSRVSGA